MSTVSFLIKTDITKVKAKIEKPFSMESSQFKRSSSHSYWTSILDQSLSFIGIGIADTDVICKNKGEKKDDFYAYGISSDLIKDVSSTGMLRVAALAEKLDYLEMNNDELADKLSIRYVAKGTLWKMDSVFQLSMELFDTKNSKVVWFNRWQTNWKTWPLSKKTSSDEILANLNIMVTKNNPEAYEYYLKGKYKFEKKTSSEDLKVRDVRTSN